MKVMLVLAKIMVVVVLLFSNVPIGIFSRNIYEIIPHNGLIFCIFSIQIFIFNRRSTYNQMHDEYMGNKKEYIQIRAQMVK